MEETKELKVIDRRHEMSPVEQEAVSAESQNALVLMAMQKGYSPELIEKMMNLQEKHEKREAEKAYHKAMAAFKKNAPKIEKTKKVEFKTDKGTTTYRHAELADAADKINKALGEQGLSAAWKVEQGDGKIKVICTITHELGHSESTDLTASADNTGNKNSIQAIGSTISYLERYTLLALTGIAAHGMDDDGNAAGDIEYVTKGEAAAMRKLMDEKNIDETLFFTYVQTVTNTEIKKLEDIPRKHFKEVHLALKNKKAEPKREPGCDDC